MYFIKDVMEFANFTATINLFDQLKFYFEYEY